MNILEKIELEIHRAFPKNAEKISKLMKKISPILSRMPEERPDDLVSVTREENVYHHDQAGKVYVTVSFMDKKPFEVFSTISKVSSETEIRETIADSEAVCRMISLSLRSGISVDEITKQLRGISNGAAIYRGNGTHEQNTSLYDAIAKVLHETKDLELEPLKAKN